MSIIDRNTFFSVFGSGDFYTSSSTFISKAEAEALVALSRSLQPKTVIEIGIQRGFTAKILLDNSPWIERYIGIDLLPDGITTLPIQRAEVPQVAAELVKDDPRLQLIQKPRGSRDITAADLPQADLIFIDGDHSFDGVLYDTLLARQVIRPGGIICWHDYNNPPVPDVTTVINNLNIREDNSICLIQGTTLCFQIWRNYKFAHRSSNINLYEKKVYSQNGEDGILEEIFNRIGTIHPYFVEFGVQDGSECNTAYLARNKGWHGLMLEGNPNSYNKLQQNFISNNSVKTALKFITKENITSIFQKYNVPSEFDLLSIDIDGNDYWIWEALFAYKPRVVVIEYNASYPPPQKMVLPYNPNFTWDGTSYFGASLSSLHSLGKRLGYSLIATDSRGVNAFFIRSDLITLLQFPELTPEEGYHPPSYGPHMGGHPHKSGPYLEI